MKTEELIDILNLRIQLAQKNKNHTEASFLMACLKLAEERQKTQNSNSNECDSKKETMNS